MTAAPKGRRLRFSLRTLFVMVTAVSMAIAWLTNQLHHVRERERAMFPSEDRMFWGYQESPPATKNPPIAWTLLGAEPQAAIYLYPDRATEQVRERYERLFPEAEIIVEPPPPHLGL